MQSCLQTVVMNSAGASPASQEKPEACANVFDRTYKGAEILTGTLPILVIYLFLQKYFQTGIVWGNVKGSMKERWT